jgi:hypothetical protein
VRALVSENFIQELGGAVRDQMRLGEPGVAVHQNQELHQLLHPVEVSSGGVVEDRYEVDGDGARGLFAFGDVDLPAELSHPGLPFFRAMVPERKTRVPARV